MRIGAVTSNRTAPQLQPPLSERSSMERRYARARAVLHRFSTALRRSPDHRLARRPGASGLTDEWPRRGSEVPGQADLTEAHAAELRRPVLAVARVARALVGHDGAAEDRTHRTRSEA